MAQHVTTERPREGVALITMSNPSINNHGSWIGIGQLAAAMKDAREAGARVIVSRVGGQGTLVRACVAAGPGRRDRRQTHDWGGRRVVQRAPRNRRDARGEYRGGVGRLFRRRRGTWLGMRSAHRGGAGAVCAARDSDRADDWNRRDQPSRAIDRAQCDGGDGDAWASDDGAANLRAGRSERGCDDCKAVRGRASVGEA